MTGAPKREASVGVDDIKSGKFYVVLDAGDADPSLDGAVVLGAASHLSYAAVTIHTPDGDWLGTTWHATRHAATTPDYVDDQAVFREITQAEYIGILTTRAKT